MSDGAMGTPAGGGADAPLRLRTFGPLGLHGRVGPLTGAAAQRRRLALLAILAVAGARGVSRDKVVALLWPERDAERARHALAQLLYAMRRDLPAGAVAADGGTLLVVDDGDGQAFGKVLGPTSIEYCYAKDGADAQAFCRVLTKSQ